MIRLLQSFGVWFQEHFVSLSSDWMNFVIAGAALWIAYFAFRASATVWLQVLTVESNYTQSICENGSRGFNAFTVTIRNRGLTLHDVKVWLSFTSCDGNRQFEMQRVQFSDSSVVIRSDGEFKPGMVGRFSLKSYVYPNLAQSLNGFGGARKNCVTLRVSTQGFRVFERRLWHQCYGLRSTWNALAYRINIKFDKTIVAADGRNLLKLGQVLPLFNDSQFRIETFVESVRRHDAQETHQGES